MIDTNSLIAIIVAIAIIYFVIKYIVSPLVKLIAGIAVVIIVIFVLQNYFGISFNQYLGPLSSYINIDKLTEYINWLINPLSSILQQILPFIKK